jgi:tetratricopeptide (TPR) repeat protein
MTKEELLERYEARGEDGGFLAAKPLYERALAEEGADARVLNEYAYLLECHGRRELRRAAAFYERAIELDPDYDKPHYQLISARAGLREPEVSVTMYEQRVADAPTELRERRFLASAYLSAHEFLKAGEVIEGALGIAREDAALLALRGEAKAGLNDPEGALSDWHRALERNPDDLGPLYATAFLLEREGRAADAAAAWRSIIEWNQSHGNTLQNEWLRRELARLTS